jgi:hypothetical protein
MLAEDAGTRTFQLLRIGARIAQSCHDDALPARYGHGMRRQCARPNCSAEAAATFTFDTRELTVWLDTPADDGARAGELCERHAQVLRPPRGWRLDDRRGRRDRSAHELAMVLDAHTPLLERAFKNAGAV